MWWSFLSRGIRSKRMQHVRDIWPRKPAVIICVCAVLLAGQARALEFTINQIADENLINRDPVISETGMVVWQGSEKSDVGGTSADIYKYKDGQANSITREMLWPLSADVHPQVQSNTIVWQTTYNVKPRDVSWILREVPTRDDGYPELWALPRYTGNNKVDPNKEPDAQDWSDTVSNVAQAAHFYEQLEGTDTTAPSTNDLKFRRHPSGDNEICIWHDGDAQIQRITEDYRNDLSPSFWGDLVAWQKAKAWPFGWEIMVWDTSG